MSSEARKIQISEPVHFTVGRDPGPATIEVGGRVFYRCNAYSAMWKVTSVEEGVESGYYEVAALPRWYEKLHRESSEEAVQLPLDIFVQTVSVPMADGTGTVSSEEVSWG